MRRLCACLVCVRLSVVVLGVGEESERGRAARWPRPGLRPAKTWADLAARLALLVMGARGAGGGGGLCALTGM